MPDAAPSAHLPADHPLREPSDLPFGLPPFAAIAPEHHLPALRAGMAAQRAEVEAIAADPGEPTYAGTVEALERSGALLTRAAAVFFHLVGADSTPQLRAADAEVAPELAAHADAIALDERLFARIADLHARRHDLGLTPEQLRLLERRHTDLVRAGAGLDAAGQEQLSAINAELSTLTTAFGTALLAETNALAVHVVDEGELAGLSPAQRAAAALAASERGLDGWVLPLALPTDQPVLADLDDRGLRERVHRASTSRGSRGGEHDTRELLVRVAALRARRAGLLGASSHAEHVVADSTAGSLAAVMDVLTSVAPAAVANALAEAGALEDVLRAAGETGPLRPWDWAWAAARERAARFDLDPGDLASYFELDAVLVRGVFAAARALYGLAFTERRDLPLYHPDARVWEVAEEDGTPLGLCVGDFFARESKRGGAWMDSLVRQSHLLGQRPVVAIVLNAPAPAPGEPALLSPDLTSTLFHEFGHALHGLLSDVVHPSFSGTSVPRDFVEYPSQVNEVWAWEPALLADYARHAATGAPLPDGVAERLVASRAAGQGFATTEILAAMLLDQAWHALAPGEEVPADDVAAFEAAALARHGLDLDLVPPRYRSTYFNHVFAGGYSAGYYAYLWSEVLDADTVDWFRERAGDTARGGAADRASGEVFRRELLARGGSVDPMEAYRAFRGRDPRIEPLLARRGLAADPR